MKRTESIIKYYSFIDNYNNIKIANRTKESIILLIKVSDLCLSKANRSLSCILFYKIKQNEITLYKNQYIVDFYGNILLFERTLSQFILGKNKD